MHLTIAVDTLLSPIEGLQAVNRASYVMQLALTALKDSKPFELRIFPHTEVLKNRNFAPTSPSITDDSVLAFAIKSALQKLPTPSNFRQTFERELKEFGIKYRDVARGYGKGFEAWLNDPAHKPTSNGNGALMRMQPILDLPLTSPLREPLAAIQASVTHGPEAVQMARVFESAHRRASQVNTRAECEDFFIYCSNKLLGVSDLHRVHREGRFLSSAKETLGVAFLVAAYSLSWDDFFDLVAWIGGDTDTLGVVAAQLATLTLGEFENAKMIAENAIQPYPEFKAILALALPA